MEKSESIKELSMALSKFQGEVKNPNSSADNPFFKSKYAPLHEILNMVRPILSKHGLSVVQAPSGDGESIIVTTTLIHSSGEYIEFSPLILKTDKATAQGAGSAITYARRYALAAILGISSEEDDDGNVAETKEQPKKETKKTEEKKPETKTDPKLLSQMFELIKLKDAAEKTVDYTNKQFKKKHSKELTEVEIKKTIEWLKGQ